MTKVREQLAKNHQSKAKEKTKHEQIRETHLEKKMEGGPGEVESVPTGNSAKKKQRETTTP
jgi:hypothetical protein